MQTTPNCLFSHFTRPTSTQALPTCKMPFSKSLPGSSNSRFLQDWPTLNSYLLHPKSNLTRYTTPQLTPPTLLVTLGSSSMINLPFPTKFQPSPKHAINTSDSFVVSVLTLIPLQRAPLPPPSFTANTITVILSTTTYLSLRLPASNFQRIQNSLASAVVKSPKSCPITPILRCLHFLNMIKCNSTK